MNNTVVTISTLILMLFSYQLKADRWSYKQTTDPKTKKNSSSASVWTYNYFHDLDFSLSIDCRNEKMFLWVSPGTHITHKSNFITFISGRQKRQARDKNKYV